MLDELIDTLGHAWDARRSRELLLSLWEQERWFDTPRQRAAAEIARDALAAGGLADVQLAMYPCDGRTRCQDWIMHMAWDCAAARLAYADGELLADRRKTPVSVVYWSAPLASAAAPAVGGVVDGDALETITPAAVDGRFVLTGQMPGGMKRRLIGTKALAVVSDFLGECRGYSPEVTRWCNAWSDNPADGWYAHAADRPMTGFMIPPAAGRRLRERMAAGEDVRLAGFCESRLYEGEGQNVVAVLPGIDPAREVWIFGHACEQGAHDNVAGCVNLIEAMRMLAGLVRSGALPQPRCSIRMITTEECIGMVAYATRQEAIRRRALVGFNQDGGGDASEPDRPFFVHYGPLSDPTFGWAAAAVLAAELDRRAAGTWHCRTKRFVSNADDMVADPNCGIPTMWLGMGGTSWGYHSSADTPDRCSDDSLRTNATLVAAWAYTMATMDDAVAAELLPGARRWIDGHIAQPGDADAAQLGRWAAGRILRDLARWGVSTSIYEPAAAEYAAIDAPPLAGLPAAGPTFARAVWGTCTFETLPHERRAGLGRWSNLLNSALYWTDGRRPLAAVERLARAETGTEPGKGPDLARAMAACVEAGTMTRSRSA